MFKEKNLLVLLVQDLLVLLLLVFLLLLLGGSLLADQLEPDHGPVVAMQGVVAATLQSPDFLFRVEIGTPAASNPSLRWLTDHELASRLAFFLTDRPPDDALLDAADAGDVIAGVVELRGPAFARSGAGNLIHVAVLPRVQAREQ